MGYEDALSSAGATVISFGEFGDYQGTWLAYVHYKGQLGWIMSNYGSCSGCDAYQAEFEGSYDKLIDQEERMIKFGQSYLHNIITTEELMKELQDQYDWSECAVSYTTFIENAKAKGHEIEFMDKFDKEVLN